MRPRDLVRLPWNSRRRRPCRARPGCFPWAEEQYPDEVRRLRSEFPDDIVTSPGLYLNPLPIVGNRYQKGVYVDKWGCRFETSTAA